MIEVQHINVRDLISSWLMFAKSGCNCAYPWPTPSYDEEDIRVYEWICGVCGEDCCVKSFRRRIWL